MDYESWFKGYETGVMLHNHLRGGAVSADGTPLSSVAVASMSVTGIAADLEWFADLSGVRTLTRLRASYSGNVTASYSYDGSRFTNPVPMAELLGVNPAALFAGLNPRKPLLYFRFHLADADADLTAFRMYGVLEQEG